MSEAPRKKKRTKASVRTILATRLLLFCFGIDSARKTLANVSIITGAQNPLTGKYSPKAKRIRPQIPLKAKIREKMILSRSTFFFGVGMGQTERRQHPQAAVPAAHIPFFSAADMIKQGLIVPGHDYTTVGDAGIFQGRECKVDQAVTATERQRGNGTLSDQVTKRGRILVSEDNTMIVSHDQPSSSE